MSPMYRVVIDPYLAPGDPPYYAAREGPPVGSPQGGICAAIDAAGEGLERISWDFPRRSARPDIRRATESLWDSARFQGRHALGSRSGL